MGFLWRRASSALETTSRPVGQPGRRRRRGRRAVPPDGRPATHSRFVRPQARAVLAGNPRADPTGGDSLWIALGGSPTSRMNVATLDRHRSQTRPRSGPDMRVDQQTMARLGRSSRACRLARSFHHLGLGVSASGSGASGIIGLRSPV